MYKFNYATDYMLTEHQPVAIGPESGAACTNRYSVVCKIKAHRPLSQDMVYSLVKSNINSTGSESVINSIAFPMGNVALSSHTYTLPNSAQTLTLETRWTYDSHGRVHSITYPDREEVRYLYDLGGNIRQIVGSKPGYPTTPYIKNIFYDLYSQRIYQLSGNDVETVYSYDTLNRRPRKKIGFDLPYRKFYLSLKS